MTLKKKSKAQIYLERVEMLDTLIENKLKEQRQWKDLAHNISVNMGGDAVQTSGGGKSRMAAAVEKCILLEDEIADAVERLIDEKREIVRTIEKLYSPMEYKILHMRYIQHIELEDIARMLKREYTWVTTTQGRALKHLQIILSRT